METKEKRKYKKREPKTPVETTQETTQETTKETSQENKTPLENKPVDISNDKSFLDKIASFDKSDSNKNTDSSTQTNTNIDANTGKRKYNKKQAQIQDNLNNPPAESVNQIISGYMFLIIIDFAFPALFCTIYNKFIRGKTDKKILSSQIKLKKSELEELQPIADEVVKKLSLNINPVYVLIIGMGSIYIGNFMALTE